MRDTTLWASHVRDPGGRPFHAEVHHIAPLADGGEDTIENVACLCPAHHREVHLGRRATELTAQLKELRAEKPAVLVAIGSTE